MKALFVSMLAVLFSLSASAMPGRSIRCFTNYWTINRQPLVVTATMLQDTRIANVVVLTGGVGQDFRQANQLLVKVAGPVAKRDDYHPRTYKGYNMYFVEGAQNESMDILFPAVISEKFVAFASDFGAPGDGTEYGHFKILCSSF